MDDAVGLAGGVEFEKVAAEADGGEEGGVEVGFGEGGAAVVEDAEGDFGAGVEEAGAEGFAGFGVDVDEISGGGVRGGGADHVGEDGGVEGDVFELGPGGGPVFAADGGRGGGALAGGVGGSGG